MHEQWSPLWRAKILWSLIVRVFASSYKRIKALVIVLYGDLMHLGIWKNSWEVPEALRFASCIFNHWRGPNFKIPQGSMLTRNQQISHRQWLIINQRSSDSLHSTEAWAIFCESAHFEVYLPWKSRPCSVCSNVNDVMHVWKYDQNGQFSLPYHLK